MYWIKRRDTITWCPSEVPRRKRTLCSVQSTPGAWERNEATFPVCHTTYIWRSLLCQSDIDLIVSGYDLHKGGSPKMSAGAQVCVCMRCWRTIDSHQRTCSLRVALHLRGGEVFLRSSSRGAGTVACGSLSGPQQADQILRFSLHHVTENSLLIPRTSSLKRSG